MTNPAPLPSVNDHEPRPAPGRPTARLLLLALWLGVVIAAWVAINVVMDDPGSADERFTGLWPLTHPYWFNPLIALVALVPAARLGAHVAHAFGARTKVGSASLAFALGVIAWCLGNLVWFWYNTCTAWGPLGCSTAIEAPYPSLADIGFLLLLPCWGFAMVQLARVLATSVRDLARLAWIPVLAFAITGYITLPPFDLLGITIANRSALFAGGYSGPQTAFSILYLCSDAALLSLSAVILVRSRVAAGGYFFRPMLFASAALLLQYVADLVFDIRVEAGSEFAGDVADLLYFFALFTMIVVLHQLRLVHERMERDLQLLATQTFEAQPAPDAQRDGAVAR